MKPKIFIVLICVQLAIIALLSINIYRQTNVLGAQVKISPIDKKSMVPNPDSELKHFYEPIANSTEEDIAPWLKEKTEYYVNSDSLREDKEYAINKPASTFRIITLGDSFTYGSSVHLQENYPKQLENLLNNSKCTGIQKFEVINLGIPSYDVRYAVERFRLRGTKYHPDLVLWLLKNDDFMQIEEVMQPLLTKYLTEYYSSGESIYTYTNDGSAYIPLYEKSLQEMRDKFSEKEITSYQISALYQINDYYNKQLVIFAFPSLNNKFSKAINMFAESRSNTYFYQYLPNLVDESQPDGHPTAKGYSLITNDIYNYLKSESLIPCY